MAIIEIPVTFFDGETEIDLGKVEITPTMTFKLLQITLSSKIGISPNHITIYFDKLRYNHTHHRRRPVTSKFDFSSLSLEDSDVFFWVVLKRSRRSRRRSGEYDSPLMLLRRGSVNDLEYSNRLRMISLNLNSHVYDELLLSGYAFNPHYNNYNYNYNNNIHNYQDNYDIYSYNNNNNYNYNNGISISNGNHSDDYFEADVASSCGSSEKVYCEVCCNYPETGETVSFHWCKNDAVTTGFRSLVGPIAPPKKSRFLG